MDDQISTYDLPDAITLTVAMTAEDIKNGVPGQPNRCPMALAIARALAEQYAGQPVSKLAASAGGARAFLDLDTDNLLSAYYRGHHQNANFINSIDSGNNPDPLPPFTITFEKVMPSL